MEEWSRSVRIVRDEVLIVAGEPQKGANVCRVFGWRPVRDATQFMWVHFQLVFTNYHSEVVDFFLLEGALLGFKVEVVFFESVEDVVDVGSMPSSVLLFGFSRFLLRMDG